MKSANWISAIGRRPARARPMATPTMLDPASGVVDLLLDLRLQLFFLALRQEPLLDDVLLHALERVLLAPGLDLLRRAVGAVVVVGGVGEVPVGLALDQRRSLAVAGSGQR